MCLCTSSLCVRSSKSALQVETSKWAQYKQELLTLCSPPSRSSLQVWGGESVRWKHYLGVSGLRQNSQNVRTAALRDNRAFPPHSSLPPRLSWREAFRWGGCCRARRRLGVCNKGILRPAGWWRGSRAAGGAAGRTCPFAAGSCTWRSPAAPRWPAPGRFPPGGSSPGSSHLQREAGERLDEVRRFFLCDSILNLKTNQYLTSTIYSGSYRYIKVWVIILLTYHEDSVLSSLVVAHFHSDCSTWWNIPPSSSLSPFFPWIISWDSTVEGFR